MNPDRVDIGKKILDRIIPKTSIGSVMMTLLISCGFGLIGVLLDAGFLHNYGLTLFVIGPFALGLIASLLHGYHEPKSVPSCIRTAVVSVILLGIILVVFAFEGLICILMAMPIALVLATFGAFIGYLIQRRPNAKMTAARTISLLIILVPLLMGAEHAVQPEPNLFAVQTSVDVNAPADVVWDNVIAFETLPQPRDLIFKAGVAYPTHADIEGRGVGATRRCHFSTGAFIEPITVWEENRLLRFDVTSQPPTMKELSPYDIHPPHLNNYLVSKQGQFLLTELPDRKTRLEGTTWYTNKMWPQRYWKVWSDHIIHRIHGRVLEHIKNISEKTD